MEELEHVERESGPPRRDGGDLVEAELAPQPREQLLVGARDLGGQLLGHRLAGLLEAHLRDRAVEGVLEAGALLVGHRGDHRLEPGLQLLPYAGHGEEPVRAHVGQVAEDLARVSQSVTVNPYTTGR